MHSFLIFIYFLLGISIFLYLGISGWTYYRLPIEERFYHSNHNLLKPSGIIGHGLGITGSLMMIIGVSSYMVRKRWRKLYHLGYLKHWLEFHIFLCSVGPILILYHTSLKFGGIITIGFWSMVIVVLSGVIGRVIYIQLPRTLQGEPLSIADIENLISNMFNQFELNIQEEIKVLLIEDPNRITESNHINKSSYNSPNIFISISQLNKQRKYKLKLIKNFIETQNSFNAKSKKEMMQTANKILSLKNKELLYNAMENLFRHWHIFHLPFAITMFVLMFVHIVVAILFGAKWIF